MAGLQGTARRTFLRARGARDGSTAISKLDAATRRVLLGHVAALLGTSLLLAAGSPPGTPGIALGLAMFAAFSALRVASVRRTLAVSTLLLDATGTAILVAGTGAPSSAYLFLAFAGAWWAAHVPRRHSGATWAAGFAFGYVALVMPSAISDSQLVRAVADVAAVAVVGLLADWALRVDARAIAVSEVLAAAPAGAADVAIRDGLTRAIGPMEIPIDVVLAASREGLTVTQAELLAYLVLGLTNQEIADATKVSVPTVRYRLTRLYRALGVSGRKAAAARAREIGLAATLGAP